MSETEEGFVYQPFENPTLAEVRRWKENGDTHAAIAALPKSQVVCTGCPQAVWMWVEKTDPAKKNAMRGFKEKAGWRCHCKLLGRIVYDEYASTTDPDAWVYGCSGRVDALKEHESKQKSEWEAARRARATVG